MNNYQIEIVPEAKKELQKELTYSRKNWGQKHSKQYAIEVRAKIKTLKHQAKAFQLRHDILPDIRIMPFRGNRIIYTILEDKKTVIILSVISNFQNINISNLVNRKNK